MTALSYLLLENLNDNKAGVAFDVRHMVITIIILSPGFCNSFVSEVQFHILSAIKSRFSLLIAMPFSNGIGVL